MYYLERSIVASSYSRIPAMVNTGNSRKKAPPAKKSSSGSGGAKKKISHSSHHNSYVVSSPPSADDDASSVDNAQILMTQRENDFNDKTWWMVDINPIGGEETSSRQGATALVKRCMRTYGWDEVKTRKVLNAYRQFITLKKEHEDWDAKILSPCYLVDQMWHSHILDVLNYYHDMMLLCGRVVGHDPDGALDYVAKQKRDETTRKALQERFGSYDEEVWDYSPDETTNGSQVDPGHSLQVNLFTVYCSNDCCRQQLLKRRGSNLWMSSPKLIRQHFDQQHCFTKKPNVSKTHNKLMLQQILLHAQLKSGTPSQATNMVDEIFPADCEKLLGSFVFCNNCGFFAKHHKDFDKHFGKQNEYNCRKSSHKRTGGTILVGAHGIKCPSDIVESVRNQTFELPYEHGKSEEEESTGPVDEDNVQKEEVVTNAKGPEEAIVIRLKDQMAEVTEFKVKRTTKMDKVFQAYAGRKGAKVKDLHFLLDGERIRKYETPEELELKDGDQIDVILNLSGC